MWLGHCFLPELATKSFLLNTKYNDTVPLCMKIRERRMAMELVIYGARQFGIKSINLGLHGDLCY